MFPQDSTGSLAGKHAGKPSTARLDRPPCRSLHAFVILLLLGLGFFIAWNERGRTRRGSQASSSTASHDGLEPQAAPWSQAAQRLPERRPQLITYGCCKLEESSVSKAEKWLAKQQHSDGSWSLTGPFEGGVEPAERVMATALAMLSFQGAGNLDRRGKYALPVRKAKDWLLANQQPDGSWTADHQDNQRSVQGLASLALCELFRMTGDAELKPSVEAAMEQCSALLGASFTDGTAPEQADSGMVWLLMALRSAEGAYGVSDGTLVQIAAVLDTLESEQPLAGQSDGSLLSDGSLAAPPGPAAMLCNVLWDWRRADPLVRERVQRWPSGEFWPRGNPWDDAQPYGRDVQSWYFATQVLHACRGPAWDRWNRELRSVVPKAQVQTGRNAGSWGPDDDRSGQVGGRLMVTCLATCALQVYYRYLPIYDHK
jgi:hypothetical protein